MPLSTTQQKYLAVAWACFETEPKIDYEKFRDLANLASAHSARELMRVTRKKLREEYGMTADTPTGKKGAATPSSTAKKTTTAKTNSTGRKRKAQAFEETYNLDDDADSVSGTPTAAGSPTPAANGRAKTPGSAKKVKKEEPVDEDTDGAGFGMQEPAGGDYEDGYF